LVCLGYPLVSSGKSKALRDEVLKALRTPVMFVQGTRDRMCPLPLLAEVRAAMTASSRLHVVETGDHSLLATKRWLKARQLSQPQLDEQTLAAVMEFVAATT
ncbi:MAG TPA: alpha/beta hydrolase, partial [Sorangium sp.]|nr:alpha/beta hydrolase [Sorangium sp.]